MTDEPLSRLSEACHGLSVLAEMDYNENNKEYHKPFNFQLELQIKNSKLQLFSTKILHDAFV